VALRVWWVVPQVTDPIQSAAPPARLHDYPRLQVPSLSQLQVPSLSPVASAVSVSVSNTVSVSVAVQSQLPAPFSGQRHPNEELQ